MPGLSPEMMAYMLETFNRLDVPPKVQDYFIKKYESPQMAQIISDISDGAKYPAYKEGATTLVLYQGRFYGTGSTGGIPNQLLAESYALDHNGYTLLQTPLGEHVEAVTATQLPSIKDGLFAEMAADGIDVRKMEETYKWAFEEPLWRLTSSRLVQSVQPYTNIISFHGPARGSDVISTNAADEISEMQRGTAPGVTYQSKPVSNYVGMKQADIYHDSVAYGEQVARQYVLDLSKGTVRSVSNSDPSHAGVGPSDVTLPITDVKPAPPGNLPDNISNAQSDPGVQDVERAQAAKFDVSLTPSGGTGPFLTRVINNTGEGVRGAGEALGLIGEAYIAADTTKSTAQAIQQVQAGDLDGAAKTELSLIARIQFGMEGAAIAGSAGAVLGAFEGPLDPVTVPLFGVVGSAYGFYAGSVAGQSAIDGIYKIRDTVFQSLPNIFAGTGKPAVDPSAWSSMSVSGDKVDLTLSTPQTATLDIDDGSGMCTVSLQDLTCDFTSGSVTNVSVDQSTNRVDMDLTPIQNGPARNLLIDTQSGTAQLQVGGSVRTLDGASRISVAGNTVDVNRNDGTFQKYQFNPASDNISDQVDTYSGSNGARRLTSSLTNYRDGSSLLYDSNDPATVATFTNYAGPNATGTVTGRIAQYADGSSVYTLQKSPSTAGYTPSLFDTSFGTLKPAPSPDHISKTVDISSDSAQELLVTEYDNNWSTVIAYAPIIDSALGMSKVQWHFDQMDGKGTPVEEDVNFSDGSSQRRAYDPVSGRLDSWVTYDRPDTPFGMPGAAVNEFNNIDGGGSRFSLNNPYDGVALLSEEFSGKDGTGKPKGYEVNYTNGDWEYHHYTQGTNSLDPGVIETVDFRYFDLPNYTFTRHVVNRSNGRSEVTIADASTDETWLWSRPDGAGERLRLLQKHGNGWNYDYRNYAYNPATDPDASGRSSSGRGSIGSTNGNSTGNGGVQSPPEVIIPPEITPPDDENSRNSGEGSSSDLLTFDDYNIGKQHNGLPSKMIQDLLARNVDISNNIDVIRNGPVTDLLNKFVWDHPPTALATVTSLTTDADLHPIISTSGEVNLFRVTMAAGTPYWFNAEGNSTAQGTLADPDLRLLASDGTTQLASDQGSGVGSNSFMSYTPNASGVYYVEAGSAGNSTGSYLFTERVADDYPSNPATNGTLAAGGSVVGTYDFVADTDWFKTTLTGGTTYRFDMESTPTGPGTQIQPRLKLFGNHGASQLAFDGNASGEPKASISYTAAMTGTYYVSAESFGSNVGTYRLSEAVISGATPSAAPASHMSFLAGSDDASPAATPASGTVMAASQPASEAATGVLLDPNAGAISPDQLFGSTGSVTQPQYIAGDGTQPSAASLITGSSSYTTSGVEAIPYPSMS